jgi:hypothetical protein
LKFSINEQRKNENDKWETLNRGRRENERRNARFPGALLVGYNFRKALSHFLAVWLKGDID